MTSESKFWLGVMLLGAAGLLVQAALTAQRHQALPGSTYVQQIERTSEDGGRSVTAWQTVTPSQRNEPAVTLSVPRTAGVWLAALGSLCLLSFLYRDNPLYKLTESIFVGVSAGYAMVVGFWTEIVQNLFGNLMPDLMRRTLLPGIASDADPDWTYLVPLVLSIMMLWRLAPVGGWIARWPLAFFIGATAGFRLLGHIESDFVQQISSTILPLVVFTADGSLDWATSLKNTTIVLGVFVTLVYFFFSVEHTGAVGVAARLGIWMLMITFGAGFGSTVMGRVALLAARMEFLFDDWLWLIDPLGRRTGM